MNNSRLMLAASIFVSFAKISPSTFGGGYAMIPVIEREVVERRKWLKTEDIADILAVAGSVPGAIAVNSAAFVGYRLVGALGAVAAMIGMILPTFAVVVLLALFFGQVHDHPKIEAAFLAIRPTVVALVVYAAYKIGKSAIVDKTSAGIALITVLVLYFFHSVIHPVWVIVAGAIAGIVIVAIRSHYGAQSIDDHPNEFYDYMI